MKTPSPELREAIDKKLGVINSAAMWLKGAPCLDSIDKTRSVIASLRQLRDDEAHYLAEPLVTIVPTPYRAALGTEVVNIVELMRLKVYQPNGFPYFQHHQVPHYFLPYSFSPPEGFQLESRLYIPDQLFYDRLDHAAAWSGEINAHARFTPDGQCVTPKRMSLPASFGTYLMQWISKSWHRSVEADDLDTFYVEPLATEQQDAILYEAGCPREDLAKTEMRYGFKR